MSAMSIDDKIREAQRLKDEGNEFVKAVEYRKALGRYAKMFLYINGITDTSTTSSMGGLLGMKPRGPAVTEEQKQAIFQLQFSAHNNSALCFIKCEEFDKAATSCTKALELQPNNTKSLFRRGQARHHLGALDQAAEDIEKAISLDPNDAMCRAELQAIRAKLKAADKKHANAFAGMFDRMTSS